MSKGNFPDARNPPRCRQHRRQGTLHVGGAATVKMAIHDLGLEGWVLPGLDRPCRYYIGVPGEAKYGAVRTMASPEVVDLAEQHSRPAEAGVFQPQILFLLDEILQGTNSQERQIAVASVLDQLLQYGAAGFISTHDLDLADAPEVKATSQVVHFREFFETVDGKEVMRFDYRIRPGSTPTTNALKLLNLVGLGPKAQ